MRRKRRVEFHDLDTLMAVVEAGSFRGAAIALALEPSAISRRMRALEDHLGASLFQRSRSGVSLTEAGRLFHEHAGTMIDSLDRASRSVSSAGQVETGKISLGITSSLSSRYVGQLIKRYRSAFPGVMLTLSEGGAHDYLAAVTDGSLDVAFVPGMPKPECCEALRLWVEPVLAALPSEDARSAQPHLHLQAFANDHFIVSCDPPGPVIHDYIIRSLSDLSFRPRISFYKVGRDALIKMVGLGFGISLVCGAEMGVAYPHVTFVPLDGNEIPFSAIWSPQNDNPALRRFLSLARRLSREEQTISAVS